MKKNNKNRLHSGFTIAELLLSMFIVMVIAVAMVPIIGPKKIKTPIVAGTHGIYECYYTPEGQLMEYYATRGNNPNPEPVDEDHCTFNLSPANNYSYILIPAGMEGFRQTDQLGFRYKDADENFSGETGNESFAEDIRFQIASNNAFLFTDSNPAELTTSLGDVLIDAFQDWQGKTNKSNSAEHQHMYLAYWDVRSPIGRAGLSFSKQINNATAGACNARLDDNNYSIKETDLTNHWNTSNVELENALFNAYPDKCFYYLNYKGSDSLAGRGLPNNDSAILFPFNANDISRGGSHSVTYNAGQACLPDGSGCEALSIQVFENRILWESSSAGNDASENADASTVLDIYTPSITNNNHNIRLNNFATNLKISDLVKLTSNKSPTYGGELDEQGYVKSSGLTKFNKIKQPVEDPNDPDAFDMIDDISLVQQGHANTLSEEQILARGQRAMGGDDQGYFRYHAHPFSWSVTRPEIAIQYGTPGNVRIVTGILSHNNNVNKITLYPGKTDNTNSRISYENNNSISTNNTNGPSMGLTDYTMLAQKDGAPDETVISSLIMRAYNDASADNNAVNDYFIILKALAEFGFTNGIYSFCTNKDDVRCPGRVTSGAYAIPRFLNAPISVTLVNNQIDPARQRHTYTNRSIILLTTAISNMQCDEGFTKDEVHSDDNTTYCIGNDTLNNKYGAIIITW